jgi:hypothetical protein
MVAATAISLAGQTQVDLRTQSKSVDFSAAQSTKPFQTGPALPATCTVGQMFFVTTAASGQNSYGCTATNVWSAQSSGSSSLTVTTAGTPVGSASAIDFSTGPGILYATSATGSQVSLQASLDTSLVQTSSHQQSGASLYCGSSGGNASAYTCAMSPTLTAYTPGMLINWQPDITGVGGPTTINIDILGARPVTEADGLSNPSSTDILAGRMYPIWYDGSVFRLLGNGGTVGPQGATGPQGPAGLTGPAGATGSTGPQGPQGVAGPTGSTGAAGTGGTTVTSGFWVPSGGDMGPGNYTTVGSANGILCVDYMLPWSTSSWPGHLGAFMEAASGHVAWGIYNPAGSLVAGTGTLNAPGEVRVAFPFTTPPSLSAGVAYGWCMSSDNASDAAFAIPGSGNFGYVSALDSTPHFYRCSNPSTTSGGVITMPSACGAKTAASGNNTSQPTWFLLWN